MAGAVDWRNSWSLLRVLQMFESPKDVDDVFGRLDAMHLGITPKRARRLLVEEGALVAPSTAAQLKKVATVDDLKSALERAGASTRGTKPQLAERLVDVAPDVARTMIGDWHFMECSAEAIRAIKDYAARQDAAVDVAKQESFEALLRGDAAGACRVVSQFFDRWGLGLRGAENRRVRLDLIGDVLANSHHEPVGLDAGRTAKFRAAVAMTLLWAGELLQTWLPSGFDDIGPDCDGVAIRFARSAVLKRELRRHAGAALVVLRTFSPSDVGCGLCDHLINRQVAPSELPDLPLPGCTRKKGCPGMIFDARWSDVDDLGDEPSDGGAAAEPRGDPAVRRLETIREMLVKGLISQEEHDAKKQEILGQV